MILPKRSGVKEARSGMNWLGMALLVFGVYMAISLYRGILEIRSAHGRIGEARMALESEKLKEVELKNRWNKVQTPAYLEEVARNDLNMQREGETLVLLPETLGASSDLEDDSRGVEEDEDSPNYYKWWSLVR